MNSIGQIYDKSSDWQHDKWLHLVSLAKRQNLSTPKKLLDLGCGTGIRTKAMLSEFPSLTSVLAIDTEASMIAIAEENSADSKIKYQICDIDCVDVLTGTFDLVLANYSLHWIKNKELLLNQLKSLTSVESLFLISTCEKLPSLLWDIDEHLRTELNVSVEKPFWYLTKDEWKKIMAEHGWKLMDFDVSQDPHTVVRGQEFLKQWYASSSGKAFYNRNLKMLPFSFTDALMKKLDRIYGVTDEKWEFKEDTLLMVFQRVT